MNIRRSRFLLPALILGCLLVRPLPAQCSVGPPVVMQYMTPTVLSSFIQVLKPFNPTPSIFSCKLTASPGAMFCFPSAMTGMGSPVASVLSATATGLGMPSCMWRCYCHTATPTRFTTFTINTLDGLPVELLDFAIDEDGTTPKP